MDRTQVTVDVTGKWLGEVLSRRINGGTTQSSTVSMKLEQRGPKVAGSFAISASDAGLFHSEGAKRSGPIEGTVSGDVFRFAVTDGAWKGELTVSGDEMAGSGSWSSKA